MNLKNDDMHYEQPSPDDLYEKIQFLLKLIEKYIDITNISKSSIKVSERALLNVIADADIDLQRVKIFHGVYPSESRELSLLTYYFLKRKPLILVDESGDDSINEKFCAYLLLSRVSKDTLSRVATGEYVKFLVYMLCNGELTKDGLYTIVRTLELLDKEGE